MYWIIIIIVIALILKFSKSSDKISSYEVERRYAALNVSEYPNKFIFMVAGGNWSNYSYNVVNNTNYHDVVDFIFEPNNSYDSNAIKVMCHGFHIGYVPRELTSDVKSLLLKECICFVSNITKVGAISIKIEIKFK